MPKRGLVVRDKIDSTAAETVILERCIRDGPIIVVLPMRQIMSLRSAGLDRQDNLHRTQQDAFQALKDYLSMV
jgi:hypothetical protein